jgi:hypothetical protein
MNATQTITTTKPSLVYQVGGFGCEVGGAVIPHLDCTGSNTVGVARSTSEPLFLNILIKAGGASSFTFNGSTSVITSADFQVVPNTGGEWLWAKKTISTSQLPSGSGAIIKNNRPFHLGITNGSGTGGTRYGYFSNFGAYTPDADVTNNGLVCGATPVTVSTDAYGTAFQWQRNGFNITDAVNPSLQTDFRDTGGSTG